MKLLRTTHFVRNYSKAPKEVQRAFDKQSLLLLQNLHHPSLRAKKYDEANNLWQARVNRDWRFYFVIQDDA
jgi:mRNA interferase RelE/StbE